MPNTSPNATRTRGTAAGAPLLTGADRPGTVRVGRTPKLERDAPDTFVYAPPPDGVLRVASIDVGLARVSLAYFDCWAKDAPRYAHDMLLRAYAFRHCWHMTTPPDMALPDRLRAIGETLTTELRHTRPLLYFVEQPDAGGTYAARAKGNDATARAAAAYGGKLNDDVGKLYAALGIIAAVCAEQARRNGGRVELRKPLKLEGIRTKEKRLEYVRLLLSRKRIPVTLGNDNDVDAAGVGIGAPWTITAP